MTYKIANKKTGLKKMYNMYIYLYTYYIYIFMLYAHICVYFYMYFLKSTRPSIWYMFYASSFPCFLELVTFPYQFPPHPKVDVSGDMNMQGSLDDNCAASQNGRGGMFFVLEEPWMGLLSTRE